MFEAQDMALASSVLATCREHGVKLALAESCTGGMIGGLLTAIAGSSDVVERGFVTYSNAAKTEVLGVSADLLRREGAVNEAVARAMAEGALAQSRATMSVAVTGIAGPGGGSRTRPVGLVHMAAARQGAETIAEVHQFPGDREAVRLATMRAACHLLLRTLVGAAVPSLAP